MRAAVVVVSASQSLMNMHNNVFLCIERIPKGCWHKIVALCLYRPLTWKRTWLSFEWHIVDEIIKKINHHPLADVHPIATMGSVPHMLDTVLTVAILSTPPRYVSAQ